MEKLKELISRCKGSVSVDINDHKSVYEDVESYLKYRDEDNLTEIDQEVLSKMIELDTIIDVHFYPNNAISFYKIYHYDLDLALQEALDILNENN